MSQICYVKRYVLPFRLTDVITLISVLSVDKYAFRKIDNIETAVRGKPQSAETWSEIVIDHPEFFRFNGDKNCVALLIRSYFPEDSNGQRNSLNVEQTQKLIDTAIALHEKEIQRLQRYGFWIPIIAAFIALLGVIINSHYSNNNTASKADSINIKLQEIESKIDKIKH